MICKVIAGAVVWVVGSYKGLKGGVKFVQRRAVVSERFSASRITYTYCVDYSFITLG